MASLKTYYDSNTDLPGSLNSNFDVDYVINFCFEKTDKAEAEAQFVKLIQALSDVGLATEVRDGEGCAVLVFVKVASNRHLKAEVYRSRVQDWLYGIRTAAPSKDMVQNLGNEPITEAERLRLVYMLITNSTNEGGAGITPKSGEWKCVQSIFALHNHQFNKQWVRDLAGKYFLKTEDLAKIKDRFGEKIAFYFAFMQSYFLFMTFPAGFGLLSWLLLGYYSPIYAIINGLWCVVFVEYWKKQETDLSVQWGVRGVSKIQRKRAQFRSEYTMADPITGEEIKVYSPIKRLGRQLLQVPFALLAAVLLGSLIAVCFGIEVFISEVYNGPFKQYLVFLPTVILTIMNPTLLAVLTGLASRLTDFENYETVDAHESAMVSKVFILNFITSYLPIFLTAFVYVPFGDVIVPHLDVFNLTVKPFAEDEKQMTAQHAGFKINPTRLKKQIIYFTVTAQVVNFLTELVVPYVTQHVFRKVKEVKANRAQKNGTASPRENDHPEEAAFLSRARNEAELGSYDVTTDFREMIVQFGYLSLFSVIWPLTAVSFFINNWIELRGDALKITLETQRAVPWRADSIGPWLDALGFLSWMGSLTTAALVYLFYGNDLGPEGNPWNIKVWGLLLTVFFSEHIYLGVQLAVRKALSKIDSPGLQKERAEIWAIRKQYLQEAMGKEAAEKAASGGIASGERISRQTLERGDSLIGGTATPEERFWKGQDGYDSAIAAGKKLIEQAAPKTKTESKKEL